MKYLITTTETYRVDSEAAVEELVNEAKASKLYTLTKYTRSWKERKQKGELVDAWYQVTLTKKFTDEKEPDCTVEVSYE